MKSIPLTPDEMQSLVGSLADASVARSLYYADGVLHFPPDVEDEVNRALSSDGLEVLKKSLKDAIDASAETERARYITPGAGQAMTYQAKAEEMRRFAVDESPEADDYPLLSAEVGVTADTLAGVASAVAMAFGAWQQVGAAIERARLSAKRAVDDATTPGAAREAAIVEWPGA